MRRLKTSLLAAALVAGLAGAAQAAEEAPAPPAQDWQFSGMFGTYDRESAQRGLQVYREVCAACHALQYVAFRNLAELGFSEAEVEQIASEYSFETIDNDTGETEMRAGTPADHFPAPFANEAAARAANNNAYPPDLSLIVEARAGGADYIHAFLIGYEPPPEDIEMMPGLSYNRYFPGHQVAMPDMLGGAQLQYAHEVEATPEQMAWDVTNFLAWASEPNMEARKQTGWAVVLFLVVFAGIMYASKRKIWADKH